MAAAPRASRPRASPPPPPPPPPSRPTAQGVLLSLWAVACVLMLVVAVSDDRAPDWPGESRGGRDAQLASARSSPVYAPSLALARPEGALDGAAAEALAPGGPAATIALVETLPVGDFNVTPTAPGTFEALFARVQAATTSIEISAMYWNLLGKDDRAVFSADEMRAFGAERGEQLFNALRDAAARGVTLRILTAKETPSAAPAGGGSAQAGDDAAALPDEVEQLVRAFPERVRVRCWSGPEWYGSGILHQKIWLFDGRHLYVGSANMDWKSLAQVMEVGVLVQDLAPSSPVVQDLGKLFDAWWLWADPALALGTRSYFSDAFQLQLRVPSWSAFLPADARRPDPFVAAGLTSLGNISRQLHASLAFGGAAPASPAALFIAAAPMEATAAHSRAFDEEALVYTIRSAKARVSLSVMDFTPYSMYTPGPIWWPALTDALLAGLYSKPGIRIRLLISEWQHTQPQMLAALKLLAEQAALCKQMRATCSGSLEIRLFRVPGWQDTVSTPGHKARWPEHSRVNHAKYIVTDARVNVGTSNMEWGYFYTTAGASINTDHEETRRAFEALFDRNWDLPYAQPLAL